MNQLNNATIEIVEMSDKLGKFGPIKKLKGRNIETGQTNTYTVYKSKQDGSDSTAWTQLQDIQVGDTVSVGYAEQSGTMPDGKSFTSRIVRNFDKDLGNGRKNYMGNNPAPQPQSRPISQNLRSGEALKEDLIIRQVAFKGVIELMTSQILVEGDVEKSVHKWTDKFTRIIKAKELANPIKEELPTIQQDEEPPFDDSDIPY